MTDSEDDFRRALLEDIKRIIVRFCKTPRVTSEIVKHVLKARGGTSLSVYEKAVGSDLGELEKMGAISYVEGKWKTTETASKVLAKYFGD